jgi:hypothetical protein
MVFTDISMEEGISTEMQIITTAIIPQHPHMFQVTEGTTR